MTEREPTKTWTVSAFDRVNNEWTSTENHSYDHNQKEMLLVEPVVAARITPDRRKAPVRDYKTLLVISDAQIGYRRIENQLIPLHDETAIRATLALARNLRPDYLVDCGDTTDFSELSKYDPDSDNFQQTLQPSLQRTHDMFAEFTGATPGAERHTVGSNHVQRLTKYVVKNAMPLYNIKAVGDKYPALSYPGLLKLDDIGWEYHDGYPTEYNYADDLAFIHGTLSVSQGSTAARLAKQNYGRNIVQGHRHSMESHYHNNREGNRFGAFVVGAMCRTDGVVPGYHSSMNMGQPTKYNENWQNGVMVIRDYSKGQYEFDQVPITNGIIRYQGKEYSGHE